MQAIDPITMSADFENTSNPQEIYVGIVNRETGCYKSRGTSFSLSVIPEPEIATTPNDLSVNGNPDDGFAIFDLSLNEAQILGMQNPDDLTFSYYENLSNATEGLNPITAVEMYQNIENPQKIFVRLDRIDNDCYVLTNFFIEADFTSGTIETSADDLQLFPNPTRGIIKLYPGEFSAISSVQLFNIHGQKMIIALEKSNSDYWEIDLQQNNSGIYFLQIDGAGSRWFEKIVKQ